MKLLITYIPFQVLLGILIGGVFPYTNTTVITILPLILLGLMFLIHHYLIRYAITSSFFFLLIVSFGCCLSWFSQNIHNDLLRKNNYINYLDKQVYTQVTLVKSLTTTKSYKRFYASVDKINDTLVNGKVLIEAPLKNKKLQVGDVLLCKTILEKIRPPISPYDFDYKAYLAKQDVYAKIRMKTNFIKIGEYNSLFINLQKVRSVVEAKLEKSTLSKNTVGLIKAMLLGNKDGVSDDILSSFTNSGVVHVIAISGMHVGVLYLMLLYTFGFVKRFKYGQYIYVLIVLICLWSFAVFSGMSSSVIRSVTMFSFFTLIKLKHRKGLVLEALTTSMVVLLLANPNYLFAVGFQLSYAAVISIVVFYPLLAEWIKVNSKIGQYFIDVLIVSIIAQVGVLPLTLHYFHQIPLQFLVANFFAVSLLPLVLYGGVVVLIIILLPVKILFLEYCYNYLIQFYLEVIKYLSSYKEFVLKDISFFKEHILIYFVLLFCIWYVAQGPSFKRVRNSLILIIACQFVFITNSIQEKHQEFVIYNSYKQSLLAIRNYDQLTIIQRDSISPKEIKLLKMNRLENKVDSMVILNTDVFKFKENNYLIVDRDVSYSLLKTKGLVLVIRNNPKVNLERIIKSIKPSKVVVDGSNYRSSQLKWKSTCKILQVPFYNVSEQGAYVVN